MTVRFPGCTADFDLDGSVTSADRPTILAAMDSVISLPIYPELTLQQQDTVIEAVLEFYG